MTTTPTAAPPGAVRWTGRQRAMLDAIGIRLWVPDAAPAAEAQAGTPAAQASVAGPVSPGLMPVRPRPAVPVSEAAVPVDAVAPDDVPAAPAATTSAAPVAMAARSPTLPPAVSPVTAGPDLLTDPVPSGVTVDPTRPAEPAHRAAVIARMDWTTLRETVAVCQACALCKRRTQTVFGTGHAEAHWMIVGEAPGQQEDLTGEPFVGASGKLLDRMLAALGLTREAAPPERQVYIANAVKCRPPGNRNPEAGELAQCEPYLVRQIALVRPRVMLALGRVAAHGLLKTTEPIGRLRGRVHAYEGVPLVVTYHPAYLLRNPEDKGRTWDDLCLAREVAERAAGAAAA